MRIALLALIPVALAIPNSHCKKHKNVYWLLAGDSTTAPDGGWGDGFLATTVARGSSGRNHGHSGDTTATFRSHGDWANVTKDIGTYKKKYDVYVTIQFGHNDQKPAANLTLEQYTVNLQNLALEARRLGATPILVTSLTRRRFEDPATGKVTKNLENERIATISVAKAYNFMYIDLNAASERYINAIGKEAASRYNWEVEDWTHLNDWGSVVFGRMVSDLLVDKYARFEEFTVRNRTMSRLIREGKPV